MIIRLTDKYRLEIPKHGYGISLGFGLITRGGRGFYINLLFVSLIIFKVTDEDYELGL